MMRKIFYKVADLLKEAEEKNISLGKVVMAYEEANSQTEQRIILEKMSKRWQVMKNSMEQGSKGASQSLSGLVGNEGRLLFEYLQKEDTLAGRQTILTAARALSTAVVNTSMGKIVASPTAGSSGILPAVLLTVAEKKNKNEEQIIEALFAAGGIGMIIDEVASTSGAEGGCQAECGTASCMAAVAAVELAGGTPLQAVNAGALALKNMLGLVCDPVAGLVEIPCVKRNAIASSIALVAADMALAGIESKIPLDEVITAMKEIASMMPSALKETAEGGLANTPTAREIEKSTFFKIAGKNKI